MNLDQILADPNFNAILALIISITSIGIGFFGLWLQRKHNRLSVKPIGMITIYDKLGEFGVAILNKGTGPLIIKSIETTNDQGIKKKYPIEWVPREYRHQFAFRIDLENVAIINGQKPLNLIKVKFNPQNIEEVMLSGTFREILANLTIRIKYTDIYGKIQPELIRNLNWFRNPSLF